MAQLHWDDVDVGVQMISGITGDENTCVNPLAPNVAGDIYDCKNLSPCL